jgi:pSer/pThr/pTyr-binding forkhead associated (FHA) protein
MSSPFEPADACDIDRICDKFEAAWRAGAVPRIEEYLPQGAPHQGSDLLRSLLELELEYRVRRGERPEVAGYVPRFPTETAAVEAVFARLAPAPSAAATVPIPAESKFTLMATEGPHMGQVFTFVGHQVFLVGRAKEAHLQLSTEDRSASRNHLVIEFNPPNCRLTDLGSRSGTFVNGQRVQTADLHHGDVIRAGRSALEVSQPVAAAGVAAMDLNEITLAPTGEGPVPSPPEQRPATDIYKTVEAPNLPVARPLLPNLGFPRIDGYQIERELGRGGMGVVYLAVRLADGSPVALKTIKPAVAESSVEVQRFLREADILRQLAHPNIVQFLAVGNAVGMLFFAMDYVEGIDAARLIKQNGPLSVPVAVRTLCKVLKALGYAHDKGFVHRDLKPANVLIAGTGRKKVVKLADFGLARVYKESRLSGLTMHGDVGGTVAFMPPEQITHFRRVKPAADQYSAAATLYNLLTARMIHEPPATTQGWFKLILEKKPVPIQERRPDVPQELAAVIHRALARDPLDRFADVTAFRKALLPFQQAAGSGTAL